MIATRRSTAKEDTGGLARPCFGGPAVSGGGDGFETRSSLRAPQQVADVVLDRLRAQMKLLRDLLRRASLLEES